MLHPHGTEEENMRFATRLVMKFSGVLSQVPFS